MGIHPSRPLEVPTAPPPAPTEPATRIPLANRRSFRLGLGLVIIALAGLVLVPRVVSYAAEDAVVQGRTALLQTPIEGLVREISITPGQEIAQGTPIAVVENPRLDRSFLNELITERNYLRRRVETLQAQATGLMELRDDLEARRTEVAAGAARILDKEIAAEEAQLAAARARLQAADAELARQTKLSDAGHTTARNLEAARAERDSLTARISELTARLELLAEERRQATRGIFMADGRFGAPYSEIRRDEIAITLLDLHARREQERNRIAQIDRQIGAERTRLDSVAAARVEAPFDGVVWKLLAPAGSEVVIGSEVAQVLDCTSTFIEILVSENRFERVAVGDPIRYRLIGTDTFRTGQVTALRGGMVATEDRSLAATLDAGRGQSFRVWAALDPADAAVDGAAFCNVGRHVDVRFEQGLDALAWVRGLWSAL